MKRTTDNVFPDAGLDLVHWDAWRVQTEQGELRDAWLVKQADKSDKKLPSGMADIKTEMDSEDTPEESFHFRTSTTCT